MRGLVLSIAGFLLLAPAVVSAAGERPNLSGTWKLDQSHNSPGDSGDIVLVIEENGETIHITETRGPNPKEDVSKFACATSGKECTMQDGADKAAVSVYYNGPVLVVLKTHGRKGSSVEKRRLSLSDGLLNLELLPIEPSGEVKKLVFSKTQ